MQHRIEHEKTNHVVFYGVKRQAQKHGQIMFFVSTQLLQVEEAQKHATMALKHNVRKLRGVCFGRAGLLPGCTGLGEMPGRRNWAKVGWHNTTLKNPLNIDDPGAKRALPIGWYYLLVLVFAGSLVGQDLQEPPLQCLMLHESLRELEVDSEHLWFYQIWELLDEVKSLTTVNHHQFVPETTPQNDTTCCLIRFKPLEEPIQRHNSQLPNL